MHLALKVTLLAMHLVLKVTLLQALNINPTSEELDQKLTETVRTRVPLSILMEHRTEKCKFHCVIVSTLCF